MTILSDLSEPVATRRAAPLAPSEPCPARPYSSPTVGVAHQGLSSHRDDAFGRDYGVLLAEWRLLQRAVFVIDRDDRIADAEYVNDQMLEPNYDAAIAAAKAAAGA